MRGGGILAKNICAVSSGNMFVLFIVAVCDRLAVSRVRVLMYGHPKKKLARARIEEDYPEYVALQH